MAEFLDTKRVGNTLIEAGVLGGGAIAYSKWLQRDVLFKEKIAKDSDFRNGMVYKHWGVISAAGLAWGSTKVTNPWLKLLMVGGAVAGVVTEIRQQVNPMLMKKGKPPLDPVGDMPTGDAHSTEALDAEIKKLSEGARKGLSMGYDPSGAGSPITDTYSSGVGMTITDMYSTGVGYADRVPTGY